MQITPPSTYSISFLKRSSLRMIAGRESDLTLLRCYNCHTGIELFDFFAPTINTSWFFILLVLRNGGDRNEGLIAILADVFVCRHVNFSSTN